MADFRLVDQGGLAGLAVLLAGAAAEIAYSGRAVHAADRASGGAVEALTAAAAALEGSVHDIRRKSVLADFRGSWFEAPVSDALPGHVRVFGVVGSSETWESGTPGDHDGQLRGRLAGGEWNHRVSVGEAERIGRLGTFSVAALAVQGHSLAWVGTSGRGMSAGVEIGLDLDLARVEHGLDAGCLDTELAAFVGGSASLEGTVDFDVSDGDGGFVGAVGAFVGMAAAGEVAVAHGPARMTAGGEAGIGFGVEIDAAAGFTNGVFEFDFGASAFLGVGGGFDWGIEIDLGAVAEGTLGVVDGAVDWISSLWP